MTSSTSPRVTKQPGAQATAHRYFILVVLTTMLAACGGGGGSSSPPPPPPVANVVKGQVVDAFVAGASVSAYQVNADGTQGPLIAGPVTTDSSGNYSLNLGNYTGPVYLTSTGGTYVDTATGQTVDLTGTGLILSAIVPNASGTVTAEITPLTTMAAQLLPTVAQGATSVSAAATTVNGLISNYFGISNILNTVLLDLSQAGCATGATQGSIDASLLLAAIGDLAGQYKVTPPALTQALISDISDGKWDGKVFGKPITLTSTTGPVALSLIEGNALSGLETALLAFASSQSNACKAAASQILLTALSNPGIFSVPAAPTGVAATPGNAQVTVSWNAVSGATSYNLYVATAPGVQEVPTGLPGYAIHLNVSSPYVLSGLTNGTTYYVVVTAVNGVATLGSESVVSAEVSATPTSGSAISVNISPSGPLTVSAGGTISFTVTVNGSTNQNVTWGTSPSTGCGSVSALNVYTAPTPTATVICTLTATSVASASATASVTVTVSAQSVTLTSISLAPLNMTIAAGATQQFAATGHYSDQSTQDLTTQVIWTSSQVAIATISTAAGTDGLATGVAAGTTVISASLGGVSEETNLTVTAKTTSVTALSTGFAGEDVCALSSDGTARCWGTDNFGSLGDGNPNFQIVSTPVLATTVSATNSAKGISMGGSTCAALTDGTVQCWGYNGFGNLGNGTTTNSLTAVTTYSNSANNPALQVSAGLYTACAVFHDGTAQCWGNVGGNPAAPLLGNSLNAAGSLTPVPVSIANPATAISVGNASACVLMADTTVQCWGSNTQGELGTGLFTGPETCDTHPCSPVPVPVTGLSNVTMISVGGLADVVCAVKVDGSVWCWGSNMYSQLGQPSTVTQLASPVQITGISRAVAVSVGYSSVCALLADGTVQCWGNDADGQMGNGTESSSAQTTPVTVSNITAANPATAISVNENSACALLQDGTVQCWGYAAEGTLGSGETTTNELVPVSVIDL
jgi:alpha-tubulin suppressor-like RCC1 family protein